MLISLHEADASERAVRRAVAMSAAAVSVVKHGGKFLIRCVNGTQWFILGMGATEFEAWDNAAAMVCIEDE